MLYKAVNSDCIEAVNFLLKNGANPNARGMDGDTPLILATKRGNPEIIGTLLEKGALVNATDRCWCHALFWAVKQDDFAAAKLLLSYHADPHAPSCKSQLLWWAMTHENFWMLKLLLDHGISTAECTSAVNWAVRIKRTDIVELLIEHGAEIDSQSLHFAVRQGDLILVQLLVAHGAPLDAKDYNDKTPLENAQQYPEVADWLIAQESI